MKKILYLLSVLISCVLFSSCKNANAGSKGSHELDGYIYKTSNGLMTYSFSDGKCTWTMDDDYLGTTQTYPYKVVGSNLYIGLDYPEFDMPVEKYASITGTISPDMNTIYMTHKGAGITYTAYRTNPGNGGNPGDNGGAEGSHELDGRTYQTSDESMVYAYAFSDGKCIWTLENEYIFSFLYNVNGSKLYMWADDSEYGMLTEENAIITGTISNDKQSIYINAELMGLTHTAYLIN